MLTKRFFISWLASSTVMFFISYVWHGVFLNDYSRLSYPQEVFLIFAAIVYLILGVIVTKAADIKFSEGHFKRKPVLRGAISGTICGLVIFLITTVIGVSFNTGSNLENLLLDVVWQIVEQAIGGIVVGIVHVFVYDPNFKFED